MSAEQVAALGKAVGWFAKNHHRIAELKAKVDAEVDRRIASHPDLADLDDWLDEFYG